MELVYNKNSSPVIKGGITTQDVEWGNDVFLRACSNNGVYAGTGAIFQYSSNGIDWTNSNVSDTSGSTDCAFGLSHFVCLRGNGAALSTTADGSLITNHPPVYAAQFLNEIVFTGRTLSPQDDLEKEGSCHKY